MNILLIGSGGREHALAWALAKSPKLANLFIAPGNPGTATLGANVIVDAADHAAVVDLCRLMRIDLVVVGPEAPLVAGLVDDLAAAGIAAFGPSRAAAALEGSKTFTKALCDDCGIPTAGYRAFRDAGAAKAHVRATGAPIVVKADGLAAGKGVVVATSIAEAEAAIDALAAGASASSGLVIEEFLAGEEASFFALSDGERVVAFGSARDHKRVGEGDTGPNTGGMGAVSPSPAMTDAMAERVMDEIVRPTVDGMRARGTPFRGVLFAGLMLTAEGPKLIEYNVRFGDPECQVLMLRLAEDLLPWLYACAAGRLVDERPARFDPRPAVTVVMAARGYPGTPEKGTTIRGLGKAAAIDGVTVFQAGTRRDGDRLRADGGRVLTVSATGADLAQARDRAYAGVDAIDWPEGFCRRDIGAWSTPR